jgi:outer membrane protein assembly factor BamB
MVDPSAPRPILYALDPFTFEILWQSTPEQLNVGGKYNTPAIARGVVFVGTDRIQAFGLMTQ